MPSTLQGRFSPSGWPPRAKWFLFAGLLLLVSGGLPLASSAPTARLVLSLVLFGGGLLALGLAAAEMIASRQTPAPAEVPANPPQKTPEDREALLLSVLDSASEGIMAFQSLRNEKGTISDFVVVLANKAAGELMNRESKSMLGKCLLGLFPGNLSEGLFDRYVRVVETRIGEQIEAFDGHEDVRAWFLISVEPWSDGFVISLEEISQRRHVEQELKASIEELERFNRAMIGRENRVLEMKSEVNLLRSRLGLRPEYKVDSLSDEP